MKNPLYLLASLLLVTAACGDSNNPADPPEMPELLFVQNSEGATLTDSTITLTGVNPKTGWFTDRPYRLAGQARTEEFVGLWGEGENSFLGDPPNAAFTCEVDGEDVNYAVELTSARMDGDGITYDVAPIGDAEAISEGTCRDANLFIDAYSQDCENFCNGFGNMNPDISPGVDTGLLFLCFIDLFCDIAYLVCNCTGDCGLGTDEACDV